MNIWLTYFVLLTFKMWHCLYHKNKYTCVHYSLFLCKSVQLLKMFLKVSNYIYKKRNKSNSVQNLKPANYIGIIFSIDYLT